MRGPRKTWAPRGVVSPNPISTRRCLGRDDDLALEGEIGGCINTFGEHDWCTQATDGRQDDRDVPERALRLGTLAAVTTTRAADSRVAALVGPICAANGERIPGVQLRWTNEKDPRGRDACGVRRR